MLLVAVAIDGNCSGLKNRRGVSNATRVTTLVMAEPVDHLDLPAREPMVVEHRDRTLFVSGYGASVPKLWKSRDRGTTWARVDVGTEKAGAIGNSDVDLAVAPDGTLYFVTMVFDRTAPVAGSTLRGQGTHISIGVSRDVGATWSWTLLSKTAFDDRPWVEVAPDGTAHVVWNDGSGVCHAVSTDRGVTWTERSRIHAQGGSSHLSVGPKGEVAVRITPFSASGHKAHDGVDLIAVSIDAGTTWQKYAAPGQREWIAAFPPPTTDSLPRWVEPVAWDAEGSLYSVWTNREGAWAARSSNRGETWTSWRIAEGGPVRYFPYLVARGRGELAATWFSGHGGMLEAHLVRFDVGDGDAAPRSIGSWPFRPDSWRRGRSVEDPPVRDTAGEYLALTFLSDGGLAVVSPIQDASAKRFGFSFWAVHRFEYSDLR